MTEIPDNTVNILSLHYFLNNNEAFTIADYGSPEWFLARLNGHMIDIKNHI
ncbi:Uncharacterized protein APZ42_026954 [Daphnia magna]|uniref:Uncharacterized protein n=1 Tax=Daphnia magna TaxID=35525 RepID=A0A164RTL8_9CRUS|nr:Uncharacterized protein APZ42_026954 [Daphnia magna]